MLLPGWRRRKGLTQLLYVRGGPNFPVSTRRHASRECFLGALGARIQDWLTTIKERIAGFDWTSPPKEA